MRSYASSREKKDVKIIYPFNVVNEIELSKSIDIFRLSIFFISTLGNWMNVFPKKMLLELNLEWKHILSVVMKIFPCKMIFSAKAHE